MSNEFEIAYLGTSSGIPTKERNPTSIAFRFKGNTIMFDCSEGSQKNLMKSKFSFMQVQHIFLSHLHGDHFFGLPGLLSTYDMHKRNYPLFIYGPKGISDRIKEIMKLTGRLCFEIKIVELKEGTVFETKDFSINAVKLKHSIECFGFISKEKLPLGKFNKAKALKLGIPEGPLFRKLQEGNTITVNGKKFKPKDVLEPLKKKPLSFAYIVDTIPTEHYAKSIKGVDLLIHEATFLEKEKERAKEALHSTAMQAAEVAKKARCKNLTLLHISSRYKDEKEIEAEAKTVFKNVHVAKDLEEESISHPTEKD